MMDICDTSKIYVSTAGASTITSGELSIFSLKDILTGKEMKPILRDDLSHASPIKAFSWNPIKNGMFATGGSCLNDSIIRLYDINQLSQETINNDGVSITSHADVMHSIKCNSIISSLSWRKTRLTNSS
jgi:hypothetical protein